MEMLDLINEKNQVIGKASRKKVEEKGLLYRASEVFVLVNKKILIEKRNKNKTKRPSYYSIVGETVQAGETFEEAAIRGVKEETGLTAENLNEIGNAIIHDELYNDHHLMRVFVCEGKGEIKIQGEEVENIQLMTNQEIEELLKSGKKVTLNLVEGFNMYKESLK